MVVRQKARKEMPENIQALKKERHTAASLLKKLHVPPRDTQMTPAHSHFSTTMQIYTHVDEEGPSRVPERSP
jgi:hypothetical protein